MIRKLGRTEDIELIAQTTYYVRSIKHGNISIHSHLKPAKDHFNELSKILKSVKVRN